MILDPKSSKRIFELAKEQQEEMESGDDEEAEEPSVDWVEGRVCAGITGKIVPRAVPVGAKDRRPVGEYGSRI